MISGTVTQDGSPEIVVKIAGQAWRAVIDTGFNGDLELPLPLFSLLAPRKRGPVVSILAGGQSVVETAYELNFPFDGRMLLAEATFTSATEILIGTHLIRDYRLEVDFPARTVSLQR